MSADVSTAFLVTQEFNYYPSHRTKNLSFIANTKCVQKVIKYINFKNIYCYLYKALIFFKVVTISIC